MALVACQECGQKISTDVKRCPGCGAKQRMPYSARLFVAGLVCFIFYAACSHRPPPTSGTPSAAASADAAPVDAYTGLSPADVVKRAETLDKRWVRSNQPYDGKEYVVVMKQDIADARAALLAIPEGNPAKTRAKELLARFDKRDAESKAAEELGLRKAYAKETEERMLPANMSATVTTEGASNRTLRIKFVLVSKAFSYQIANKTQIIDDAFMLGFQRVILDDGHGERYTWTPNK